MKMVSKAVVRHQVRRQLQEHGHGHDRRKGLLEKTICSCLSTEASWASLTWNP